MSAAAGNRAVVVRLHVPSGAGFPDTPELVDLAETLHELARDLVPGATSSAEVEIEPATDESDRPGTVLDLDELRSQRRAERAAARRAAAERSAGRGNGRGAGRSSGAVTGRPRTEGRSGPGGTR